MRIPGPSWSNTSRKIRFSSTLLCSKEYRRSVQDTTGAIVLPRLASKTYTLIPVSLGCCANSLLSSKSSWWRMTSLGM